MDYLADTGFLIDLWRERDREGPATRFARANASRQVAISWTVAGEFLSGALCASHDAELVSAFLARYAVVHSCDGIVARYAHLFAHLRKKNDLLGPNDLWIAAAALAVGLPLLSRNKREFSRVPDLEVVDYSAL
ncbi:MAG: type II toxin-antitoxin system VapC family toxin [Kiritimatiellae bacterium]|nr:type II toxin-antitoxin system VapC family toxin [Kiritimatiellia bacterium]